MKLLPRAAGAPRSQFRARLARPTRYLAAGHLAAPALAAYRDAVADLLAELSGHAADAGKAEKILAERISGTAFSPVLAAAPGGSEAAIARLASQVRDYRPSARSSATDLGAHIRIQLFAQIDIAWWGRARAYVTDADLMASADLVDLEELRRRGVLRFAYRRQAPGRPARAVRAAERRLWPGHAPRTAGLRFTRARREVITLLNGLAADFASAAPPGSPPLWVTSLARSIQHQHRLRDLGYGVSLPSAHCAGYAVDVEMDWLRRFGARDALAELLLSRQRAGEVNVIDEGQAWHVCLSPAGAAGLREAWHCGLAG